ncbi:radical SAM protein [Actinotalea sp.]|uniref:radical SAM protein n=1 Tax=Actinotalea sp. TaxID=1872145 RepID=UPI0035655554
MAIAGSGPALLDAWGRVATDLRVSLTDRCTLRCTYCMPAGGLEWLPSDEILTDHEVIRLIAIAVERLGVDQVRFTGGEPLIRRGLETVVAATAALRTREGARPRIALTTNGLLLEELAAPLFEAGLRRINVHLDTLDPARFRQITRRGGLRWWLRLPWERLLGRSSRR